MYSSSVWARKQLGFAAAVSAAFLRCETATTLDSFDADVITAVAETGEASSAARTRFRAAFALPWLGPVARR